MYLGRSIFSSLEKCGKETLGTQKLKAEVSSTFWGYQAQLYHQRAAHFLTSSRAEIQALQTNFDSFNIETGHRQLFPFFKICVSYDIA